MNTTEDFCINILSEYKSIVDSNFACKPESPNALQILQINITINGNQIINELSLDKVS